MTLYHQEEETSGVVSPVRTDVVNEGNTPLGQSPLDEPTADVCSFSSERKEDRTRVEAAASRLIHTQNMFYSHVTVL